MNSLKILILVSTVTLLGACGDKKTTQPNMVGQKKAAKVTKSEDGSVVFQSAKCEAVKADSLKAFCEIARDRIKADDSCKEELAISFISEKCDAEVESSDISDYLATLQIQETGEVTSEDNKINVVEVNPEDKEVTVTGGEISIISLDLGREENQDVPVTTSIEIQDAVDTANDAAATAVVVDDVDTAHVVYIPDLSDEIAQVQVQSQPAIQVSTFENEEKRSIETRIEEINDTEVQHISQRDQSLSIEEDARNKCKDLYKRIRERPTRRQMKKCIKSAEVRRVN